MRQAVGEGEGEECRARVRGQTEDTYGKGQEVMQMTCRMLAFFP